MLIKRRLNKDFLISDKYVFAVGLKAEEMIQQRRMLSHHCGTVASCLVYLFTNIKIPIGDYYDKVKIDNGFDKSYQFDYYCTNKREILADIITTSDETDHFLILVRVGWEKHRCIIEVIKEEGLNPQFRIYQAWYMRLGLKQWLNAEWAAANFLEDTEQDYSPDEIDEKIKKMHTSYGGNKILSFDQVISFLEDTFDITRNRESMVLERYIINDDLLIKKLNILPQQLAENSSTPTVSCSGQLTMLPVAGEIELPKITQQPELQPRLQNCEPLSTSELISRSRKTLIDQPTNETRIAASAACEIEEPAVVATFLQNQML